MMSEILPFYRLLFEKRNFSQKSKFDTYIQGDFESCADILITSYWLHVELGKNV
jgi:hypothetical protein